MIILGYIYFVGYNIYVLYVNLTVFDYDGQWPTLMFHFVYNSYLQSKVNFKPVLVSLGVSLST